MVVFDQNNILIINLSNHTKTLDINPKILNLLKTYEISSDQISLLLDKKKPYSTKEYDVFFNKTYKEEHVVEKKYNLSGEKFSVSYIDYYSSADRHKNESTIGVHGRDIEIFLCLEGNAVLEIATEIVDNSGQLFAPKDKLRKISITKNTFMFLPPIIQGNRWVSIGKNFRVSYFPYPGPYDASTKKSAVIKEHLTLALS